MSQVGRATGSPSIDGVLRRLFLTLFLRGRTARGLNQLSKRGTPPAVKRQLALMLTVYALFGLVAFYFIGQPVFALATYLHAMSFVLLGMYVASSAGEVLFNKEEADILLHRPIEAGTLVRARIVMLAQVSLWLACAFNFAGFFVGLGTRDGTWLFPLVHLVSVSTEALFTTATVVVVYQLCLRWFGREKLDTFMTATQVIVSIAVVIGAQVVPQAMQRVEGLRIVSMDRWWSIFLPPAWFAGIDDALAGSGSAKAWWLASIGVAATAGLVWVALTRLARDYQTGLQSIAESSTRRSTRGRRRMIDRVMQVPPLSWWLRDSASRASFRLVTSYLARDRDVKLRVLPAIAPMLAMPVLLLLPSFSASRAGGGLFGIAFAGVYLGLVPMSALSMLTLSQQWQAADVFRVVPIPGPAALCHGARRAVLAVLTFPMMVAFAAIVLLMGRSVSQLIMLLPGIIVLPVLAMIPCLDGDAVPLSRAPEAYKAAWRGLYYVGAMVVSGMLGAVAVLAKSQGWLGAMLVGEAVLAGVVYAVMRAGVERATWGSLE